MTHHTHTYTKKDKQHLHVIPDYFKESWKAQHWVGKFQLVVSMLLCLLGFVVAQIEWLIQSRTKQQQTSALLEIEPGKIWQFTYMMHGHCSNCIIIKGNDGKLLLRSPPPIHTTDAVDTINKLGEPGIILASLAHDSFIDQWKDKFPHVKIISGKTDLEVISDRVKVDVAIEDSGKLLENYYITKVLPTMFTRYEDHYLVLQLPGRQYICLMPCGYANITDPGIAGLIEGTNGLTFMRLFAHLFAANPANADRQTWQIVSEFPEMKTFVFLHGTPLGGPDASKRMLKVHADKARHITPFGF
jgi:hypothetical protein